MGLIYIHVTDLKNLQWLKTLEPTQGDNFVDAQKAADGILAGFSLPGFLTTGLFFSFRSVLETVGMYELPSLHFSWTAEELYSFTQGVAVYSSGVPGCVPVPVCLSPCHPSPHHFSYIG